MTFRCAKCGVQVQSIEEGLIRCPSCGYRILYKLRDPLAKTVKVE